MLKLKKNLANPTFGIVYAFLGTSLQIKEGDLFMNILIILVCLVAIVVLGIYWTLWKTRNELKQNLEKMVSVFTQIGQSPEKKPVGN